MRSKTEWVIGEGKGGKMAPQKIGLAPEQGKGLEYEFDILVELDQQHQAAITKDRTGKFQDEQKDKPGEDFGVELYNWLVNGNAATPLPEAPVIPPAPSPAAKAVNPAKPSPKNTVPDSQKEGAGDSEAKAALKKTMNSIVQEIGKIIVTVSQSGEPLFPEPEREEVRNIIKGTKLNEEGIADLQSLKDFIAEELKKREAKEKAA
jgi:hypothetical protein